MKSITYPNHQLRDIELTIGICGSRLSGKDFTANLIQQYIDIPKASLADPIKEQYAELMDISIEELYEQGPKKELHRVGLITLGAARRQQHVDWWCESLHKKMQNKIVIIPDIRFTNEVKYFDDNSTTFLLFEVSASEKALRSRGWKKSFADTTTTETERLKFKDRIDHTFDTTSWGSKGGGPDVLKVIKNFDINNKYSKLTT